MGHIGPGLVAIALVLVVTAVFWPDGSAFAVAALHASGVTFVVAALIEEPR